MPPRRILVTGAAGFLGGLLVKALLDDPRTADARLVLLDAVSANLEGERVESFVGDLGDPDLIAAAIGDGVDIAYHLAAVVGGAAEADYALARRINVDATLNLFELLRQTQRLPRVVFASSIAVFGEPPPPLVDDDTVPRPTLVYGAQKHMMEIALAQFSARGWLDGLSVRIPAVVAKPVVPGLPAVFFNDVFHAFANDLDMVMPVSPEGTAWMLSREACVAALIHAGCVPADDLAGDRTLTLPALRVEIGDLVAALARHYPAGKTRVEFAPDPKIQAQFATQPPLSTRLAERLGFRSDRDVDTLVTRATAGPRLP